MKVLFKIIKLKNIPKYKGKKLHTFLVVFIFILFFINPTISNSAITNGANAIDVLGQYDDSTTAPSPIYTKGGANNGPNGLGFSAPQQGIVLDSTNHRLFVSDTSNNRVLVYNLNADDTLINRIPDNILGQINFYTNTIATTQEGMSAPRGLAYDSTNNRLFVVDTNNHRILIFDVSFITDGEPAVNVLGQPDFVSGSATTTSTGMSSPNGVAYDNINKLLFVAESGNNRVVVFNLETIINGQTAINVLGQSDFTSSSAVSTLMGMSSPQSVAYDGINKRFFVAESNNHRVAVFDVNSITDGEPAINILGTGVGVGTTNQTGIKNPQSVAYDSANQRLFVSNSNRVTVYDVASITDGENAVNVLGQADFTSSTAATTQSGMSTPQGLAYDSRNNRLYVGQSGNHCVTVYNAAPSTVSVSGTVYSDEGRQ